MSGPFPASEIPQLTTPGFPVGDDRREGWRLARRWGGYPELEWSFPVFAPRVGAFSGQVPALFYEPLTDFDATRRALRFSAHLDSRGDLTAPLITVGFEYFDRAYLVGDGRLRLPGRSERFRGRHAVAANDHDDLETIMFANSWGEGWGDSGYGYIDREYFESHVDAVWITWPATRGRSPKMNACLRGHRTRRLPTYEQELGCWSTENEYWRESVLLDGVYHELLSWHVLSWDSGRLVDVLELRSPSRIVGRLHLHYGTDIGMIKELFVAPKTRRRGYGSILEQVAVDRCSQHDLMAVQLWLGEADAQDRLRATPEAFGEAHGYAWSESTRTRPNVPAIATKDIR
jgi:GNAT superfamily N-acetyltransferase